MSSVGRKLTNNLEGFLSNFLGALSIGIDWVKQSLLLFLVTVKVSQSLNLPVLLRSSADLAEKEIKITIKEIYNELMNFWGICFVYY
jgi:hypothetical protein